jgi:phytoene dehydrogenase-like protein
MDFDAVVLGSGPNGLAAAIELARAGCSVCIVESRDVIGGGARSAELTLKGFVHDVCSAIHPLAAASPFLKTLPLNEHGLEWIFPPAALAHPFNDGTAAVLERSIERTGETIEPDAANYADLVSTLVRNWDKLAEELLSGLRIPRHPVLLARFAGYAVRSTRSLAERCLVGYRGRSFFAGLAAHSILPFDRRPGAAFGLILAALGHSVGWPIPRGGSQTIAEALGSYFRAIGGKIITGAPIASLRDLPQSRVILCDVTPRQLLRLAGDRLPASYRRALQRYRYGPGVFKIDWALRAPVPWSAHECVRAGTIHVGGTFEEIRQSEDLVFRGEHPSKPFVLLAQQSLFDSSRAPSGMHTAWAYCHVPNGSTVDMTEPIEAQIERFAPGFKDCILARSTMTTHELESYNPNYVGGDINGGMQDLRQLWTRPVLRIVPWSTPVRGLYICSSSTPPGGGVHGMCGYHAARSALTGVLKR